MSCRKSQAHSNPYQASADAMLVNTCFVGGELYVLSALSTLTEPSTSARVLAGPQQTRSQLPSYDGEGGLTAPREAKLTEVVAIDL